MAIIKGAVIIYAREGGSPLAEGSMYLHISADRGGGSPRAQGTISPVAWLVDAPGEQPPGSQYRLVLDDGRTLDIILTRHILTDCGPEVLRFNAADPRAAATLADKHHAPATT